MDFSTFISPDHPQADPASMLKSGGLRIYVDSYQFAYACTWRWIIAVATYVYTIIISYIAIAIDEVL